MKTIRKRLLIFFLGFFLSLLIVFFTFFPKQGDYYLVVGGKCTEGYILAEIIAQLIEHDFSVKVKRRYNYDGTYITFEALKSKDIDLYVEYTGTAYTGILKRPIVGKSPEEVLKELRKSFLETYDLLWLDGLGFQSAYVLIMNPQKAERYQIETLSDLERLIRKGTSLKIAFDPEFMGREEVKLLREAYHLPIEGAQLMDHTLLYLTLNQEIIDVINGYSTDGFCRGLKILQDDKKVFPVYDALPIIRREVWEKHPELQKIFNKIKGIVSEEVMQELNYEVEKKKQSIYTIAHTFLISHALIHD